MLLEEVTAPLGGDVIDTVGAALRLVSDWACTVLDVPAAWLAPAGVPSPPPQALSRVQAANSRAIQEDRKENGSGVMVMGLTGRWILDGARVLRARSVLCNAVICMEGRSMARSATMDALCARCERCRCAAGGGSYRGMSTGRIKCVTWWPGT